MRALILFDELLTSSNQNLFYNKIPIAVGTSEIVIIVKINCISTDVRYLPKM